MNPVFFFNVPVFFLLGWTALSAWRASRRGASEEKAHALAWRRRARPASHAANATANVMILGDSENRAECTVKRVSGSSLRAVSSRPFGEGSQVRIEWRDDVFIGNVSAERADCSGFIIEVALLSSTYSGGLFARLARGFPL